MEDQVVHCPTKAHQLSNVGYLSQIATTLLILSHVLFPISQSAEREQSHGTCGDVETWIKLFQWQKIEFSLHVFLDLSIRYV